MSELAVWGRGLKTFMTIWPCLRLQNPEMVIRQLLKNHFEESTENDPKLILNNLNSGNNHLRANIYIIWKLYKKQIGSHSTIEWKHVIVIIQIFILRKEAYIMQKETYGLYPPEALSLRSRSSSYAKELAVALPISFEVSSQHLDMNHCWIWLLHVTNELGSGFESDE